jgi:nucleotide-binding universal stress UspA family protein
MRAARPSAETPKEAGMRTAFVVWLFAAAATSLFMAHRGHSWFGWAIIGGAFGPLSWPLAAYTVWSDRPSDVEPPVDADVLVAVPPWLGSPEPIVEAVRRLEPLARTATLASVLDAEDATTPGGRAQAAELDAQLARCAEALRAEGLVEPPVERRILYGRPADELARFAASGDFRAIVLGPDASAAHHLLRGHIRARLERLASVPVFSARREQVVA